MVIGVRPCASCPSTNTRAAAGTVVSSSSRCLAGSTTSTLPRPSRSTTSDCSTAACPGALTRTVCRPGLTCVTAVGVGCRHARPSTSTVAPAGCELTMISLALAACRRPSHIPPPVASAPARKVPKSTPGPKPPARTGAAARASAPRRRSIAASAAAISCIDEKRASGSLARQRAITASSCGGTSCTCVDAAGLPHRAAADKSSPRRRRPGTASGRRIIWYKTQPSA